jgi:hypothetical protein
VLTVDLRFEGYSTESWSRLLSLFKPRAAAPELEASRPRGLVICIHDGDRIQKLFHSHKGRIDPRGVTWPVPLSELANDLRASWAIGARTGALEEVMERFGARLRRDHDLTEQSLLLVTVVREMMAEGLIERWPTRLHGVPQPQATMVDRALDSVCADGNAIVIGIFKGGEVWTSLTMRRQGRGFDVLAGPEDLRPMMGLLSGDWRRDYRHLARAVEERYAPVSFGLFAEADRFRSLLTDPRPGAWGGAVAVRDIVVSPTPPGVRLALGLDGARYAFESVRVITGRIEALRALDPVFASMRKRVGTVVGDRDVSQILGFDPMAALRALLRR